VAATHAVDQSPSSNEVLALSNLAGQSVTSACSPGGQVALTGVPQSLQGSDSHVNVNGTQAQVLLSSGPQVTFQCPSSPPGTSLSISLDGPNGISASAGTSMMREAAPEIFALRDTSQGVVLLGATNEIAMPANQVIAGTDVPGRPAQQGELLTIYASGVGALSGTAAGRIKVVVGGAEIDPVSVGLAPGTPGLSQIDFQLPQSAPAGPAVPLYLKVILGDGTVVESNEATVAIAN